jgi:hypothetical protein
MVLICLQDRMVVYDEEASPRNDRAYWPGWFTRRRLATRRHGQGCGNPRNERPIYRVRPVPNGGDTKNGELQG